MRSTTTTDQATRLPVGAPLKRDYRWNEYEFYAQDTWKILSNLTLTYGVRYSYLQAPAETSGTQVGTCQFSGSVCKPYALTEYINGSAAQAAAGGAANNVGEVAFNLNGRYNHAPDFWTPEKKDFGPRLAIAFSPAPADGFWKTLFGNQKSSIRLGYSLVFDHFGAATVNIFDTTGSYGLVFAPVECAGIGTDRRRSALYDHQRSAALAAASGSRGRLPCSAGGKWQRQLCYQLGAGFGDQNAVLTSARTSRLRASCAMDLQ